MTPLFPASLSPFSAKLWWRGRVGGLGALGDGPCQPCATVTVEGWGCLEGGSASGETVFTPVPGWGRAVSTFSPLHPASLRSDFSFRMFPHQIWASGTCPIFIWSGLSWGWLAA